jgi:hypothetical protein
VLVLASAASRRAHAPRHTLTGGMVLAFALTVALTACSTCTGTACGGSEAFRAGEMKALRGLKLISYFPARSSWQYMWEDFQPGVIGQDMARIAGLHANGVRIIISTAAFGFPRPHPQDLSELRDVTQMAQRNGLRVQLTLFDGFGSWQAIQGSREWVRTVLAPYAADSEIAFVELRNEIDLSDPGQMTWCRDLLPYTENLAGGVPVTVSVSNGGASKLVDLRRELGGVKPDFWDLHYYGTPGDARATFAAARAAVRPDLLYIGEFGFSTWPGIAAKVPGLSSAQGKVDAYQAYYYAAIEAATQALGLPPAAPWTLNDFSSTDTPPQPSPAEYFYGLYRLNGSAKPAATVISQFFGTGKVAVSFSQDSEEIYRD